MIQAESDHLGCVCQDCGYRCNDCLGTNTVVGVTNLPRDSISAITGLKIVSIQNSTTNRLDGVALQVTAKNFHP